MFSVRLTPHGGSGSGAPQGQQASRLDRMVATAIYCRGARMDQFESTGQ
jgi:hypothetical protein